MPALRCDRIWRNLRLAPMNADGAARIEDGVVAAQGGRIVFAGAASDAPDLDAIETIDCDGRWATPGLIDCHTHLVYAGDRAREFEKRLTGASYEEIARAGGGIVSTMRATRAASEVELRDLALKRLDALIAEGVTTIEIKSGYGLSLEAEMKQLRVARSLAGARAVRVRTTLLGAHALPPEFARDRAGYIDLVCAQMIPEAARLGLADAVDAFCEGIGFTLAETRAVFEAARAHGLRVKLHAEQLSNQHGAALAAEFGALSADHLEHVDAEAVAAIARAGVTAVMLPGAFYFTRETKVPPIELFRSHGVPMALATDCNPGTSPLTSLMLAMNMGATLFRMSVAECLLGVTRHAARALGLGEEIGSLEIGKACDMAIWSIDDPAELVYNIGANPLHARVWGGA